MQESDYGNWPRFQGLWHFAGKEGRDDVAERWERVCGIDGCAEVGAVLEALREIRRERPELVDDPAIVGQRSVVVHALVDEDLDVVQEKPTPVLKRHDPRGSSRGEIVGLRENPGIAQHAASDQYAVHALGHALNDLLGLDAVAAAEHRNLQRV